MCPISWLEMRGYVTVVLAVQSSPRDAWKEKFMCLGSCSQDVGIQASCPFLLSLSHSALSTPLAFLIKSPLPQLISFGAHGAASRACVLEINKGLGTAAWVLKSALHTVRRLERSPEGALSAQNVTLLFNSVVPFLED